MTFMTCAPVYPFSRMSLAPYQIPREYPQKRSTMTMPMPTPAASPSQTPELYALLSELLYLATARCSPVKDATLGVGWCVLE